MDAQRDAPFDVAKRSSSSPAVRSPLERKPIYVDLESQVLLRVLARFLKPVAERAPEAPILFTEMLPGPDGCRLRDANGRYSSELRVVAVHGGARRGG